MPEIVQLVPFCVRSQSLHRMIARDSLGAWMKRPAMEYADRLEYDIEIARLFRAFICSR